MEFQSGCEGYRKFLSKNKKFLIRVKIFLGMAVGIFTLYTIYFSVTSLDNKLHYKYFEYNINFGDKYSKEEVDSILGEYDVKNRFDCFYADKFLMDNAADNDYYNKNIAGLGMDEPAIYQAILCNEKSLDFIKKYVVEGKINLEKLKTGEEIIVCFPKSRLNLDGRLVFDYDYLVPPIGKTIKWDYQCHAGDTYSLTDYTEDKTYSFKIGAIVNMEKIGVPIILNTVENDFTDSVKKESGYVRFSLEDNTKEKQLKDEIGEECITYKKSIQNYKQGKKHINTTDVILIICYLGWIFTDKIVLHTKECKNQEKA